MAKNRSNCAKVLFLIILYTCKSERTLFLEPESNFSEIFRPNDITVTRNLSFFNENLSDGQSNEALSKNDKYLSIQQLVQEHGFELQDYKVETQDGYKLKIFRIPGNGPAVLLMHGLFCSADEWLTAGPDRGIAYLLASEGFDVWLGNARGNKYSRSHTILDPDKQAKQFWNFSWDEIGRYDLPAMIDFILRETGQNNIKYVGHSQGTTAFFVLCSERPEYNNKISLMVALSAVAWMSHLKSPLIRLFSPLHDIYHSLYKLFGFYELKIDTQLINSLKTIFCNANLTVKIFCSNFLFLFCGFDHDQINVSYLPIMISRITSSISIRQLVHYGQGISSGKFRKFDYGILGNVLKYKSIYPPEYCIKNITTRVAIFYSNNDWLADPIDVNILKEKLPNVVSYYQVHHKKFNHLDFIWAKNIQTLVFDKMRNLIKTY